MAQSFRLRVGLKGQNDKISYKTYDLGEFDLSGVEGDEYEAAVSAADQVVGALDAITDGAIASVDLTCVSNPTLDGHTTTAYGTGDVFEAALLNLALLNQAGETEPGLVGQSYVPAPNIGIFMGATGEDRDIIDRADATLGQYVQQLEQHTVLSDGQSIDPDQGTGGLMSGRRVVKKMRLG